jgi:hypothetical protein
MQYQAYLQVKGRSSRLHALPSRTLAVQGSTMSDAPARRPFKRSASLRTTSGWAPGVVAMGSAFTANAASSATKQARWPRRPRPMHRLLVTPGHNLLLTRAAPASLPAQRRAHAGGARGHGGRGGVPPQYGPGPEPPLLARGDGPSRLPSRAPACSPISPVSPVCRSILDILRRPRPILCRAMSHARTFGLF